MANDQLTEQSGNDAAERQAQLLAAARALRTWINDQRATWPERSDDWFADETPRFAEPLPSPPAAWVPIVTPIEVAPEPTPELDKPAQPPPRSIDVSFSIGDDSDSRDWGAIARRVVGLAASIAVVAAVGAGSWKGWHYLANRPSAPPKMGTAVLESMPPGSDLFVDGKLVGKTPVVAKLSAGPHSVEFRRRNSSRKLNINVPPDGYTKEQLDWTEKRKGSLEVLSDPDGASVSVDGVPRGVTPLTIDDLALGSHTVVLEGANGSIKRTVTVAADRVAQVTEAIYSGWMHVSTPIELQILEGTRSIELDERNQALLGPGTHVLQFQNTVFGYQERKTIEVKPGAITSVSIEPPSSLLTVAASLPGEVLVDGQRLGELPITDRPISLGTRLIVVRSITGAERRFTVTATVKPVSLVVDFARP